MAIHMIGRQTIADAHWVHYNGSSREKVPTRGHISFTSFLWRFFVMDYILKLFQVKADLASLPPLWTFGAPLSLHFEVSCYCHL